MARSPHIGFQEEQGVLLPEDSSQGFVLSAEQQPEQPIPLQEVHWRGWIPWLNPHHAGVHLGRGAEIVLANLQQ